MAVREPRAEPPRVPPPTRALLRADAARQLYRSGREALERRSVLRGLLLIVLLVLALSIARAGTDRVFPPGWLHR